MNLVITVAFCPAAQLARSLMMYVKTRSPVVRVDKHVVVDGHYPINRNKNKEAIKLICDAYDDCELWDPGHDIGSAQCQNWVLNQLRDELETGSTWINLDPDAACVTPAWNYAMQRVMKADPKCAVITCNSPMVQGFIERRHQVMEERTIDDIKVMIPAVPTPFNLSMWNCDFLKEISGIPQKFPFYGEVEGPMFAYARALGYWTGYLRDYIEDEEGKRMHDEAFEEWKDAHARNCTFLGSFKEFCLEKGILSYDEEKS